MAKNFHIGDVLSISTGMLVSLRGMEGIYDILNYMTGDNLFTHQLPRAFKECQPWLLRWHPQLDSPEMRSEVARLEAVLKDTKDGKEAKNLVVSGWVAQQYERLGEFLEVKPIPADDHEHKDPIAELIEMRGGTDGIVVVKPE